MAVVERPLTRCRVHERNLTRDDYRMAVAGVILTECILANPGSILQGQRSDTGAGDRGGS